jgi:hypothetical protein
MWLMRERIRKSPAMRDNARRTNNPLDVFGTDVPDDAFEGVPNFRTCRKAGAPSAARATSQATTRAASARIPTSYAFASSWNHASVLPASVELSA